MVDRVRGSVKAADVVAVLHLPDRHSEAGTLIRLFLCESKNPSDEGFDLCAALDGMKHMRQVIANRGAQPGAYAARGRDVLSIVRAKGQFKGFEHYPEKLEASIVARLQRIMAIANDPRDRRHAAFARFVTQALRVANAASPAVETQTPLVGWRTAGTRSPGAQFVPAGAPLGGNQFYRLVTA